MKHDMDLKSKEPIKPLRGKSIFLDLRGYRDVTKFEENLKTLGAKIETSFSKDVHILVSSRKDASLQKSGNEESPLNPSPFNCSVRGADSPGGSPSFVADQKPLTRGQAIARKANVTKHYGTTDILNLAKQWKIKVIWLDDALKLIKKELDALAASRQKNGSCRKKKKPNVKSLSGDYVKFESTCKQFRPVQLEFTAFPDVAVNTPSSCCPFDKAKGHGTHNPLAMIERAEREQVRDENEEEREGLKQLEIHVQNCAADKKKTLKAKCLGKTKGDGSSTDPYCMRGMVTAGDIRRMQQEKIKAEQKRGYCELCEVKYEDLYEHVRSEQHRDFVRNDSNYQSLDTMIEIGSTMERFLNDVIEYGDKHYPAEASSSQESCDGVNLLSPYKSPLVNCMADQQTETKHPGTKGENASLKEPSINFNHGSKKSTPLRKKRSPKTRTPPARCVSDSGRKSACHNRKSPKTNESAEFNSPRLTRSQQKKNVLSAGANVSRKRINCSSKRKLSLLDSPEKKAVQSAEVVSKESSVVPLQSVEELLNRIPGEQKEIECDMESIEGVTKAASDTCVVVLSKLTSPFIRASLKGFTTKTPKSEEKNDSSPARNLRSCSSKTAISVVTDKVCKTNAKHKTHVHSTSPIGPNKCGILPDECKITINNSMDNQTQTFTNHTADDSNSANKPIVNTLQSPVEMLSAKERKPLLHSSMRKMDSPIKPQLLNERVSEKVNSLVAKSTCVLTDTKDTQTKIPSDAHDSDGSNIDYDVTHERHQTSKSAKTHIKLDCQNIKEKLSEMKTVTPFSKSKKRVTLRENWSILSEESIQTLFQPDSDDEEFEGFGPNNESMERKYSFVEVSEVEFSDNSEREWYVGYSSEIDDKMSPKKQNLTGFVSPIKIPRFDMLDSVNPHEGKSSEWDNTMDSFIDESYQRAVGLTPTVVPEAKPKLMFTPFKSCNAKPNTQGASGVVGHYFDSLIGKADVENLWNSPQKTEKCVSPDRINLRRSPRKSVQNKNSSGDLLEGPVESTPKHLKNKLCKTSNHGSKCVPKDRAEPHVPNHVTPSFGPLCIKKKSPKTRQSGEIRDVKEPPVNHKQIACHNKAIRPSPFLVVRTSPRKHSSTYSPLALEPTATSGTVPLSSLKTGQPENLISTPVSASSSGSVNQHKVLPEPPSESTKISSRKSLFQVTPPHTKQITNMAWLESGKHLIPKKLLKNCSSSKAKYSMDYTGDMLKLKPNLKSKTDYKKLVHKTQFMQEKKPQSAARRSSNLPYAPPKSRVDWSSAASRKVPCKSPVVNQELRRSPRKLTSQSKDVKPITMEKSNAARDESRIESLGRGKQLKRKSATQSLDDSLDMSEFTFNGDQDYVEKVAYRSHSRSKSTNQQQEAKTQNNERTRSVSKNQTKSSEAISECRTLNTSDRHVYKSNRSSTQQSSQKACTTKIYCRENDTKDSQESSPEKLVCRKTRSKSRR